MWLWWSLAHDMIGGLWSNLGWQRVAAAWAPVPTVLSFVVAAIASIGAGVAIGPRERISGFA